MELCTPTSVGVAIDTDAEMLSQIRTPSSGSIETSVCDLESWMNNELKTDFKYDAIFCIGSLPSSRQGVLIENLFRLLNPTGRLIIGELVWINPEPSEEFVSYTGIISECYMTFDALKSCIESNGLSIKYSETQSLETYEKSLLQNVENWAEQNQDDADVSKILEMSRSWVDFGRRCAWTTWHFATIVGKQG